MVPSVYLGDVGAILRLGLVDVLRRSGVALVDDVRAADAALVDLDAPDCRVRAARLTAALPGLTVIACSAQRPAMLVVHGSEDGGERPCTPVALGAILRRAAERREPDRARAGGD